MKELFETILPAWTIEYVHLPYMFAVWLIVEWLRYEVDNIDFRIKPKHLTLLVGTICAFGLHFGERYFEDYTISLYKLGVSFLMTTWVYEYGIKILKERIPFLKNFTDKQKQ